MKRTKLLKIISLMTLGTTLLVSVPFVANAAWKEDSVGYWYTEGTSSYATGWRKIDNTWYYFDKSGYMKTGWVKDGSAWYYLDNSGAMQTGWIKDGSVWYYLDKNGAMRTGWIKDGSSWYYLDNGGAMKTGWITYNSNSYYLDNSGAMQTGWVTLSDKNKVYFNVDGSAANGWTEIDGKTYYFVGESGMTYNDIRDDYYIDDSGVRKNKVKYSTVEAARDFVEKEDSNYISSMKAKDSDFGFKQSVLNSNISYAKEFGIENEPCLILTYNSSKDEFNTINYIVGLYSGKLYAAPESLGRTYEIKDNEKINTYDAKDLYDPSNVTDWR